MIEVVGTTATLVGDYQVRSVGVGVWVGGGEVIVCVGGGVKCVWGGGH